MWFKNYKAFLIALNWFIFYEVRLESVLDSKTTKFPIRKKICTYDPYKNINRNYPTKIMAQIWFAYIQEGGII